MKSKITRRALLSSCVALMLCFSMLLGTTYAWFTDEVTSAGNIIQSGTLDVEMYWADGTKEIPTEDADWNDASKGAIFNYNLWEPGYTEVRHIKIANIGTLALKYQLMIQPNGVVSELTDVIDVYYTDPAQQVEDRADLDENNKQGTLTQILSGMPTNTSGTLEAGESAIVTLSLKMQEEAGNKYQNLAVGTNFSVKLLATQLEYENDSFGNDYDADAQYPGIADANALYDSSLVSGVFTLTADVKTSDADPEKHYNGNREYAIKNGNDYTLNLNGHTITHDGTYQDGKNTGYTYLYTTAYNGKLTMNGNGTINSANSEGNATIFYAQGPSEIVINGGNYNVDKGIAVWAGNNGKVTINGGSFISTGAADQELIYSSGGVIDIYGGFFHNTGWESRPVNVANANRGTGFINIYGGTFVNFDPSTGGDDPNNIKIADGYKSVAVEQDNGDVWYTVVADNVSLISGKNAEEAGTNLKDAVANAKDGDTFVLTQDTTVPGYDAGKKLFIDSAVTIDLNGKTLTTESGWGGIDAKGGCTIKNGTINHTGNTAAIKAFQVKSIENVTINVTETAGKTKGGIVVQNGAGDYVGSIKNVTITGATNGIECYRSTNNPAIGSMENVKIDATANGIYLNGAGCIGEITNCEIKGGNIGINAYLANLWHISLNIKDSKISGGVTGIDIWDEGATNTGSTVAFNYDSDTTFAGSRENIKVTLQEEITCTINGVAQGTPCDLRFDQ